MKNTTTIFDILQTFLTEEEVKKVSESLRYVDTARRFTLYDLIKFFIAAATNEYKSYRHGVENMEFAGLTPVDYSTISKKATDVNYEICKTLFEIIVSKCNRSIRRILKLPKQLAAVDSTTITVGENRVETGLESIAVTWYLCTRPFPKVIATAPTRQQLYDVLWAEISKKKDGGLLQELLSNLKTCRDFMKIICSLLLMKLLVFPIQLWKLYSVPFQDMKINFLCVETPQGLRVLC